MNKYQCLDCNKTFYEDEADIAAGLSDHKTNGAILEQCEWYVCPECGSDQLDDDYKDSSDEDMDTP